MSSTHLRSCTYCHSFLLWVTFTCSHQSQWHVARVASSPCSFSDSVWLYMEESQHQRAEHRGTERDTDDMWNKDEMDNQSDKEQERSEGVKERGNRLFSHTFPSQICSLIRFQTSFLNFKNMLSVDVLINACLSSPSLSSALTFLGTRMITSSFLVVVKQIETWSWRERRTLFHFRLKVSTLFELSWPGSEYLSWCSKPEADKEWCTSLIWCFSRTVFSISLFVHPFWWDLCDCWSK